MILDLVTRACYAGLIVALCDYFIVGFIDYDHLLTVMIWYSAGLYTGWSRPLGTWDHNE